MQKQKMTEQEYKEKSREIKNRMLIDQSKLDLEFAESNANVMYRIGDVIKCERGVIEIQEKEGITLVKKAGE
jgi:hypothetical protein